MSISEHLGNYVLGKQFIGDVWGRKQAPNWLLELAPPIQRDLQHWHLFEECTLTQTKSLIPCSQPSEWVWSFVLPMSISVRFYMDTGCVGTLTNMCACVTKIKITALGQLEFAATRASASRFLSWIEIEESTRVKHASCCKHSHLPRDTSGQTCESNFFQADFWTVKRIARHVHGRWNCQNK